MGNETSQLAGLEIDEKAVEVTDFWTHHSAVMHSDIVTPLSVFIGEPLVGGALWINQTPLEKATKNLMLHRHPCILKYISSWNKGSKLYLAVEYVKPLAHVISTQTTLQICIGLHSVLKALLFLHDKALASHNNVCSACVYVTQDGSWKLGGLEYLCRFQDLQADYLTKTRAHRYEKAIDPDEDKNLKLQEYFKTGAIDKYAFAVLVDEVLRRKGNSDIACLEEFRQFCKSELQNRSITARPCLETVLKHEFFTHSFIVIYSFLTELPLKSEPDKVEFFTGLAEKLRVFPEEIVARQLGELLLSRLVLLDRSAQNYLLPYILVPKQDVNDHIFSEATFKQNIVPKLLHIFRVRDAQIRLLLLAHFKNFVAYFTKEQLQNHILPELLIGIKDTNDQLVSITLIALSHLVPILGAATVIGGKRAKLFNDGRPAATKKQLRRTSRRNSTPSGHSNDTLSDVESPTIRPALYLNQMLQLPERPSPDGGEEEISTTELDQSAEDDLENWSDWDVNDTNPTLTENQDGRQLSNELDNGRLGNLEHSSPDETSIFSEEPSITPSTNETVLNYPASVIKTGVALLHVNKKLPDILELDIKNQKNSAKERSDEFDFFQDMEPVIEMSNIVLIEEKAGEKVGNLTVHMMNDQATVEEGWGDDLDWTEN